MKPRRPARSLTTAIALALLVSGCSSRPDPTGSGSAAGSQPPSRSTKIDLQAHRGGAGERTENSIASFSHALDLGVTTLEMDTQITKDGKVVVTHDNTINPQVCADTAPAAADDPQYPYVGKVVHELTLAQLQTLDCGFQQRPDLPEQVPTKGSKIPELRQVFDLVKSRDASVLMNIETKIDADAPQQSAPVDQFVSLLDKEITASGLADQVTIQSFHWGSLQAMHKIDPTLPLVALTTTANTQMDLPGASPWLGGLDIDDYDRDVVKAAHAIEGVTAVSPAVADVTPELVQRAHALGLTVIPWTVDDPGQMQQLIDIGVDGIITNYPTRLRTVLAADKLPLPPAFPA